LKKAAGFSFGFLVLSSEFLFLCCIYLVYTKADRRILLLSAAKTDAPSIPDTRNSILVENRESRIEYPLRSAPEQVEEWQTVRMRVTAYCPCQKCCGEYSDGMTACGHRIHPGDAFAAADRQYPFGTEMIVAGYNNDQPIKVLDRGGAIRGDRLDVFFPSHEEALQWGVKYLDVKIKSNPPQ